MNRNISFSDTESRKITDDSTRNNLNYRESSAHDGKTISTEETTNIRRNDSWLWDWKTQQSSVSSSANNSQHGGHFFTETCKNDISKNENENSTAQIKRNMSFIWNWAKYRESPNVTPNITPNNSNHNGAVFENVDE